MVEFIIQPNSRIRLGDYLNSQFRNPEWTEFNAAVAFVKYSGVRHNEQELTRFSAAKTVRMVVGVDCQGSSVEGLDALLRAVEPHGQIWICHNENESTFHPKVYMFCSAVRASVVIGSGNLTAGGLFTNYEASIALSLAFEESGDVTLYRQIEETISQWTDPAGGTNLQLDARLLENLAANSYVLTEAQQRDDAEERARTLVPRDSPNRRERLFSRVPIPPAPRTHAHLRISRPVVPPGIRGISRGFVMTLQQTDAGYGQTSRGTSRRSPEIFVPLAARNYAPEFWGWRRQFNEDASNPGKWDRRGVSDLCSGEKTSGHRYIYLHIDDNWSIEPE